MVQKLPGLSFSTGLHILTGIIGSNAALALFLSVYVDGSMKLTTLDGIALDEANLTQM